MPQYCHQQHPKDAGATFSSILRLLVLAHRLMCTSDACALCIAACDSCVMYWARGHTTFFVDGNPSLAIWGTDGGIIPCTFVTQLNVTQQPKLLPGPVYQSRRGIHGDTFVIRGLTASQDVLVTISMHNRYAHAHRPPPPPPPEQRDIPPPPFNGQSMGLGRLVTRNTFLMPCCMQTTG